MSLSVIIPIAPNETSWKSLLVDLQNLDESDECILVSPDDLKHSVDDFLETHPMRARVQTLKTKRGRAIQQNKAAELACNSWLWFLHCDSHLSNNAIQLLKVELKKNEDHLYFFDLKFSPCELKYMWLNEIGVKFRSNILKIPFGDQGLCLKKMTFNNLDKFSEQAEFGEDHLLVWKAHKEGIKLKAIESYLFTSARKYQRNGWGRVTFDHILKTIIQASPEVVELIKRKVAGRSN